MALKVGQYELKVNAGKVREILQLTANEIVVGASYQAGHMGTPGVVVFLIEAVEERYVT